MSRTKWHGLEQRKANYRTREWVKSLSNADAKRMNINKEKAIKNLNNG
jgi:leucyl-tRNA synthetase